MALEVVMGRTTSQYVEGDLPQPHKFAASFK
jgi:hypothetical protein